MVIMLSSKWINLRVVLESFLETANSTGANNKEKVRVASRGEAETLIAVTLEDVMWYLLIAIERMREWASYDCS